MLLNLFHCCFLYEEVYLSLFSCALCKENFCHWLSSSCLDELLRRSFHFCLLSQKYHRQNLIRYYRLQNQPLILLRFEQIQPCQMMNSKDLCWVSCGQPCRQDCESFKFRLKLVTKRKLKYSNESYLISCSDQKHQPIIGSCYSDQISLTENLNELPYLLMLITYLHLLLHFELIMRTSEQFLKQPLPQSLSCNLFLCFEERFLLIYPDEDFLQSHASHWQYQFNLWCCQLNHVPSLYSDQG